MKKWLVTHELLDYTQHPNMIGNVVSTIGSKKPSFPPFAEIEKGDIVAYYAGKDHVIIGIFEVVSDIKHVRNDPHWQEAMVYRIKPIANPPRGKYLDFNKLVSSCEFDMFPSKEAKKVDAYLRGKKCLQLSDKDYLEIKLSISDESFLRSINEIGGRSHISEIRAQMEYEKLRQKIIDLQSDLALFKVEFLGRDEFKKFADNLDSEVGGWTEICITGYFSETIRGALERIIQMQDRKLRLVCQEFDMKNKRDRKNLEVLKRLCGQGAEVKVNSRLHARFLAAYNPQLVEIRGLLVVGSFDFNTECIGKERYDAGIKTANPDLIVSSLKLFEEIWNDPESIPFSEKYLEKPALKG